MKWTDDTWNAHETCKWFQDGDGEDAWDTQCGNRFVLNDGTPAENRMHFCCYCGKALSQHPYFDEPSTIETGIRPIEVMPVGLGNPFEPPTMVERKYVDPDLDSGD